MARAALDVRCEAVVLSLLAISFLVALYRNTRLKALRRQAAFTCPLTSCGVRLHLCRLGLARADPDNVNRLGVALDWRELIRTMSTVWGSTGQRRELFFLSRVLAMVRTTSPGRLQLMNCAAICKYI